MARFNIQLCERFPLGRTFLSKTEILFDQIMKKILIIAFSITLIFTTFYSCKKVTNKEDSNNISEDEVWQDTTLITAFANNLYTDVPTWNLPLNNFTDETRNGSPVTNGTVTPDTSVTYWPYNYIRKINLLIQQLPTAVGSQGLKNRLTGEAKFLRAYQYFAMIRRFGGMPIITIPQDLNSTDLFVSRNSTSECFDFMVSDLDEAITLLPAISPGANVGRVSREAAYALKAKIMVEWASPRYNPNGDQTRWQEALTACNEAITRLNGSGYGLYEIYGDVFLREMNKEVIFAIRYANPGRTHNRDATVRPISVSANGTGGDQPTQELVDAYPMRDGTDVDPSLTYQQRFRNRDDRFYATIVYNGATYFGRRQWTYVNSGVDGYRDVNGTYTGYYSRKAVDTTTTAAQAGTSGTDFIAIRYADILLLQAEAANETGNAGVAYANLVLLRQRANILPGSNNMYGLIAGLAQQELRSRIQKERQVEMAFEQNRFFDLLRWNLLYSTLNGKTRTALRLTNPTPTVTPTASTVFTEATEPVDTQILIIQNNSPFYPIPRRYIQNNPNLLQNQGWENGSFNPLL